MALANPPLSRGRSVSVAAVPPFSFFLRATSYVVIYVHIHVYLVRHFERAGLGVVVVVANRLGRDLAEELQAGRVLGLCVKVPPGSRQGESRLELRGGDVAIGVAVHYREKLHHLRQEIHK
eukprot:243761-Pyramimonas_sp.AAC.1